MANPYNTNIPKENKASLNNKVKTDNKPYSDNNKSVYGSSCSSTSSDNKPYTPAEIKAREKKDNEHYHSNYSKYEDSVTNQIEIKGEMDRSDAQGLVMSRQKIVDEGHDKGWSSKETAKRILDDTAIKPNPTQEKKPVISKSENTSMIKQGYPYQVKWEDGSVNYYGNKKNANTAVKTDKRM